MAARQLRVLLFATDPDLAALFRDFLERRGHAVCSAGSHEEVRQLVHEARVDVVLAEAERLPSEPLLPEGSAARVLLLAEMDAAAPGPRSSGATVVRKPVSLETVSRLLDEVAASLPPGLRAPPTA